MTESIMTELQEAALRKAAWRLVPILTISYVVNYLDRTNIGFAALTMNRDLGLTATQFGIGAGMVNVYNSWQELTSGQQTAAASSGACSLTAQAWPSRPSHSVAASRAPV